MSDATNDTTRTAAEIAEQITGDILADLTGRRGLRQEWEGIDPEIQSEIITQWNSLAEHWIKPLIADLDRLAGPVCDHPPCKGARAVEHTEPPRCTAKVGPRGETTCGKTERYPFQHPHFTAHIDGPGHEFQPDHPPAPEIEAWLRARSAK